MPDINQPATDPQDAEQHNTKQPNQQTANSRNAYLSEQAAYKMVIGSMVIALGMVFLLSFQTYQLNKNPKMISLENVLEAPIDSDVNPETPKNKPQRIWLNDKMDVTHAAKIALEYDAQFLRTKRAQSLVSARLFIQSIAILAGVILIGMGSSFVFARINTPQASSVNYEATDGGKFEFASYSPGLFLALLGTVIICASLIASVKSKTKTTDAPVFLEWPQGMRSRIINEAQRAENIANSRKKKEIVNAVTTDAILKALEDK